ncbi:rod shape-determining protein MreD [Orbaceae bacterium ac157xtp]
MNNKSINNYWLIWVTLFIGLLLEIFPWSESILFLKPHWLMLILFYWTLALPERVGIYTVFLAGIILDLFLGTVIGVHAFVFAVVTYFVAFRFQLIRNLALWQQSFVILGLSICYNLCLLVLGIILYRMIMISPMLFFSCVVDAVMWVIVYLSLNSIKTNFVIE